MKKVAIVMGSDSDWNIMKSAKLLLDEFGIEAAAKVVSAHRTPELLEPFCKSSEEEGINVIIAGAGGAAHLPGMLASYTHLPIIGVPIKNSSLEGLDSLYSIVQMPGGVPVATVGINNATNAALLAIRILSLADKDLVTALKDFRKKQKEESILKTKNLI